MIFKKRLLCFVWITSILCFLLGCEPSEKPMQSWVHSNQGSLDAALDPNGKYALIATMDRGTLYWDLSQNQILYTFSHAKQDKTLHRLVKISGKGDVAATLDDQAIATWNTKTGESLAFWKLPAPPLSIDITGDGRFALIGFSDNKARIIDLQTGITWRTFEHADQVNSVVLSKDDQFALMGSDDTAVRLWNLNSGKMVHQWFLDGKITKVALSNNNQYAMISSAQNKTEIVDTQSGKRVSEITIRKSWVPKSFPAPLTISTALFSKDNTKLYTGSPPRHIRQWDIATGKLEKEWVIPKRYVLRPTAAVILALTDNPQNTLVTQTSNGMGYQFLLQQ